jgi:SPP1 family holin
MDKGTVVRTVLLAITWINVILTQAGLYEIPAVSEEQIALGMTFIISVWTWFKNNYITAKGKRQKRVLEQHDAVADDKVL